MHRDIDQGFSDPDHGRTIDFNCSSVAMSPAVTQVLLGTSSSTAESFEPLKTLFVSLSVSEIVGVIQARKSASIP